MNAEEKIQALESLLEKVRTNAAKPRPARGTAIATSQPAVANRATDDVAGPAVAATPARVAPPIVAPGTTKFGEDDWSDTTETFDTPVPLAAPLPGPAKEAAKSPAAATPKPGPAKPATTPATTTPKPIDTAAAKPGPAPVTPAAKPATPAPAAKPVAPTPAVKPVPPTPLVKPTTPANAPIPLTNKVTPPVIKTPALPNVPATTAKPLDANVNKTLTGVGDGAVKAPDIRAGAIAAGISLPITGDPPPVEPIIDLEKKPLPAAKADAPAKPSLPSAIEEAEGEEENEPTQLYEPSAASRRAAELAALSEKQLDDAKRSLGIDKKGESDKVEIRLPDAKDAENAEKIDLKDAPKIDLPWVEKSERKIDPAAIGLPVPDDKPSKKGPSRTELDLELVASQEGNIENVDLDVGEGKAEAKPETDVAQDKPTATPEPAPISEKKPVLETKRADVKPAPIERKPLAVEPPVFEKASPPTKGVPKSLIIAAVILLLAVGAFVAMQQGWIGGGGQPTTKPTVAPPTNTTAAPTPSAAPTAPATAQPPATTDTAAPAASASAAPADSAAAPADSAAAPADSAAAPPASASAAAPPATAPATAGTPSVDPATLNNNQGLIFVTSNKPARVYLTGKLAGETNGELKVDCGLKFVRLADPNQDIAKPPMWLTAGEPKQIDCRKYTTFTLNVP